jgi:hypothetical protein
MLARTTTNMVVCSRCVRNYTTNYPNGGREPCFSGGSLPNSGFTDRLARRTQPGKSLLIPAAIIMSAVLV